MPPARRIYCTFCGQTYVSSDAEKCSLCNKSGGIVDPMAPEALADLVAKKQADPTGKFGDALVKAANMSVLARNLIRLTSAGIVTIVGGISMIALPGLREDPGSVSVRDVLISSGVLLAGSIMLGYAYVTWQGSKQADSADTLPKGKPPRGDDAGTSPPS